MGVGTSTLRCAQLCCAQTAPRKGQTVRAHGGRSADGQDGQTNRDFKGLLDRRAVLWVLDCGTSLYTHPDVLT